MKRNLLLVSNSTLHGSGYLDHCADEIQKFLGNRKTILFIPYARPGGLTHDEYTKIARERFQKMGIKLTDIHESSEPKEAVKMQKQFLSAVVTLLFYSQIFINPK